MKKVNKKVVFIWVKPLNRSNFQIFSDDALEFEW